MSTFNSEIDATGALSSTQEGYWLAQKMSPADPRFNQISALILNGDLSREKLVAAVEQIVRRHDILRAGFREDNGKVFQFIRDFEPLRVPFDDIRHLSVEEQRVWIERLIKDEGQASFNLRADLLIRFRIVRTQDSTHLCFMKWHHIVTDGRSAGIFQKELSDLYKRAREPPFPPLQKQFRDFIALERAALAESALQSKLTKCAVHLQGVPPLALPTDFPRPQIFSSEGSHVLMEPLPPELTRGLEQLASQHRTTLYTVLQGVMNVFFRLLGSQRDFAVGTSYGGRKREFDGVIGPFAQQLALRVPAADDPIFTDLLRRVSNTLIDAFRNAEVPFRLLVEQAGGFDPSRTPIFQVVVDFREYSADPALGPDLTAQMMFLSTQTCLADLAILFLKAPHGFANSAPGLVPVFSYRTDLFREDTIRRMGIQLRSLIGEIIVRPTSVLSSLSLIGAEERQSLLASSVGIHDETPFLSFNDQFGLCVARDGDRVAVEDGGHQYSYSEIDHRVQSLHAQLVDLSVREEIFVLICADHSIDTIVAMLAVGRAGAVFINVDSRLPAERVQELVADSGASVLITTTDLQATLNFSVPAVVYVDRVHTRSGVARRSHSLHPRNAAYVVLTSGSSGIPKGVMVEHLSLSNALTALAAIRGVTRESRELLTFSSACDAGISQILVALTRGGTLVVGRENAGLPTNAMVGAVLRQGITGLGLTPDAWSMLVNTELPTVRTMFTGGQTIDAHLLRGHVRPGRRVLSEYGPTETTITSNVFEFQSSTRNVYLGPPIANVQVYVLDAELRMAPLGVIGEICIGGMGVARGYADHPEWTAEKFVPDPFSRSPGSRLYKTGDRARRGADGSLEFVGRIDEQVKIRGFRVELGDVSAALRKLAPVKEAFVMAAKHRNETVLVSFVTLCPGPPFTGSDLRSLSARILPTHMIPSAFIIVTELPKNSIGKVDRHRLPPWEGSLTPTRAGDGRAANLTEQRLREIWARVLERENISLEDNFFELGGHSLLLAQLEVAIFDQFKVELPIRVLLANATIPLQASVVDSHIVEQKQSADGITRARRPPPTAGASFTQESFLRLTGDKFSSNEYNVASLVLVQGPLDCSLLPRVFSVLARQHKVLAASYRVQAGALLRTDAPNDRVEVAFETVESDTEEGKETETQRRFNVISSQEIHFDSGPLVRVAAMRWSDTVHALAIVSHRLLVDGPSLVLLAGQALESVVHPFSTTVVGDYSDFAATQRERLSGPEIDLQLDFWNARLQAKWGGWTLPTDRTLPHTLDVAESPVMVLDGATTMGLARLAQQRLVSFFSVLLATFFASLESSSEGQHVCVSIPMDGRDNSAFCSSVGPMLNSVVVRVPIAKTMTDDFLALVNRRVLEATAHGAIPFSEVVFRLGLTGSPLMAGIKQLAFSYHEITRPIDSSLSFRPISTRAGNGKFALSFAVERYDAQLSVRLSYDPDKVSPNLAKQFQLAYGQSLCAAAGNELTSLRWNSPFGRNL